ncbi:MAG: ATP synthase F1 subunit gamma [Bdellovibrio sp.]
MPSLKDIRTRIDSTKNTQQITRAMKLVSAAKLRKAQHQIMGMRPYAISLLKAIANIAASHRVKHPLLAEKGQTEKLLLVVLSSDRGLCGGFNSGIIKATEAYLKENSSKYDQVDLIFMGRKAAEYFQKRSFRVLEVMNRLDRDMSYKMAAAFAERCMQLFTAGDYCEVKFLYNEFRSAISQKPVMESLLPVDISKQNFAGSDGASGFAADMIFEPRAEVIIDELLKKHFSVQVFRCMAESVAAEHGARMTAMENATNNAKEVLNKLTLTYNKVRQEKITRELIEIVSGAEAL